VFEFIAIAQHASAENILIGLADMKVLNNFCHLVCGTIASDGVATTPRNEI
jgi:hypothetical protein